MSDIILVLFVKLVIRDVTEGLFPKCDCFVYRQTKDLSKVVIGKAASSKREMINLKKQAILQPTKMFEVTIPHETFV